MSDTTGSDHRLPNVLEIVSAVVLSVAALMTSWSAYQSALWDGVQAANYSRANGYRVTASRNALQADTYQAIELAVFNSWLTAEAHGDHGLAAFYRARFPADFQPAFERWVALKPLKTPNAPSSPFEMREYRLKDREEAARLDVLAEKVFEEGQRANEISDAFVQASVILAMALFFGGIGQVFKLWQVRAALLVIAIVACVWGVASILSLPTQRLN